VIKTAEKEDDDGEAETKDENNAESMLLLH